MDHDSLHDLLVDIPVIKNLIGFNADTMVRVGKLDAQVHQLTGIQTHTTTLLEEMFGRQEEHNNEVIRLQNKIIELYERRARACSATTEEERQRMVELWRQGVSKHQIAIMCDRARSTVRDVLKRAGLGNLREVRRGKEEVRQ